MEFCIRNQLKIGNTSVRKKKIHKITRQVLNRNENAIIIFLLIAKYGIKYKA